MDGREVAGRPSPALSRLGPQLLPLLSAAVGLLVVVGAALAGPWQVTPRAAPSLTVPTQTATAPPTADPVEVVPPEPSDSGIPVTLVLVVLGILLLAVLVRMVLRRATLARGTTDAPYDPSPGAVGAAEAVEVEPDLPALRRGVAAARAVLASGADPDDAIIAAWLELEAAAASSGVERAPSDTPTELTTAVLDATSADPDATRRLLRLYHRARFAPHAVMTPGDVAEAGRCLERLAESWEGR
ncbi:DUF4129 domain-containing protein [Georgenia sp. H159]|uniref:DUF4129 domain-containing protein n=1 Tax=Georgenia sp. H159 TaxID=3076115 RepID=UPI002D7811BC|nr:DUF4129 domain-containing protein [Georgenia sp. H159]